MHNIKTLDPNHVQMISLKNINVLLCLYLSNEVMPATLEHFLFCNEMNPEIVSVSLT